LIRSVNEYAEEEYDIKEEAILSKRDDPLLVKE